MVVRTRSRMAVTLSRRTLRSACASTPCITSFTRPMYKSIPTESSTRSSTFAKRLTFARRSLTSKLISSTLTTGTSRNTSGILPFITAESSS